MKAKRVHIPVAGDESLPNMVRRKPGEDRIRGDVVADEVIEAHVQRAGKARSNAEKGKRERVTPKRKQVHGIDHDVHGANESARQADARTEIDRDSELPNSWRPPTTLDAPPPRPGYRNRWGRFRRGSEEDAEHFDGLLQEGWVPVRRSSVRKVHELTATTHGQYGQYYVKRGLILMEIPEKYEIERDRYYRQQQKDMNRGVDRNLFKINNRVMPLERAERSTRTTLSARRGRLEDAIPGDEAEA